MYPTANFYKSTRALSGFQTYCKSCAIEAAIVARAANPERRKQIERASRLKHLSHYQWQAIRARAVAKGVPVCSMHEFRDWFNAQPPECAYCSITNDESVKVYSHRLHVDRMKAETGYMPNNMVLACQRCNLVKNKYLTHSQMKEVATKYFKAALDACEVG